MPAKSFFGVVKSVMIQVYFPHMILVTLTTIGGYVIVRESPNWIFDLSKRNKYTLSRPVVLKQTVLTV